MLWSPLLKGPVADRALEAVREIAEALRQPEQHIPGPSYAGGLAGVALFYGHAAVALEDKSLADPAWMFLDRAMQLAEDESLPVGFFAGLTGLAWTMQHLQFLLTGAVRADLTEEADDILSQVVRLSPWTGHFDLVYGLTGIGVYALDHPNKSVACDLIAQVVERLRELAVYHDSGISWRTPPELIQTPALREKYPNGYKDLGVAHGASGVLGFLAHAVQAGLAPAGTLDLLEGGIRWLLAQRRPDDGGSAFGGYSDPEPLSCRSAWCYGDPGIALQLLAVGRTLDRPELERLAIEILVRDTKRPEVDTQADGPSLCHGAAGLGHLYNLFYQATGERTVEWAAQRWFERALAMRKPGEGIAGYRNWWPNEREWHAEAGFLTGAAGIGLTLLTAACPVQPSWGRPMLL
jgi:lantibiotic modifying enzyme